MIFDKFLVILRLFHGHLHECNNFVSYNTISRFLTIIDKEVLLHQYHHAAVHAKLSI